MERTERRIVVEAILVETNPDAVLPVPAECRDKMARLGVWVLRVLADTGTLAGVDLIDKQSGVCPDPQFVLVFFEEAVDQDRKLVDVLNV